MDIQQIESEIFICTTEILLLYDNIFTNIENSSKIESLIFNNIACNSITYLEMSKKISKILNIDIPEFQKAVSPIITKYYNTIKNN